MTGLPSATNVKKIITNEMCECLVEETWLVDSMDMTSVKRVWEKPVGRLQLYALLPPTHSGRNFTMESLDFRDDGGGKCRRLTQGTCRLPKAARRIADRLSLVLPSWCFASEALNFFLSSTL